MLKTYFDSFYRLKNELEQNEDASKLRKVMKDQLAKYPDLVRQNEVLRKENKLLNETAENSELLKEEIGNLKRRLEVSEVSAEKGLKAESDLVQAQKKLNSWEGLCEKLMSEDEKANHGSGSLEILSYKIGEMQRQDLTLQEKVLDLKKSLSLNENQSKSLEEDNSQLKSQIVEKEKTISDQTGLVKKLQRKLLLVSKERDSYKGLVTSFEAEITFSSNEFEKGKIAALETVVGQHKDMLEKLEVHLEEVIRSKGGGAEGGTTVTPDIGSSLGDMKKIQELSVERERLTNELSALGEKYQELELELERRAMKGDYDTATTKVLHFKNNPVSQAVASRAEELRLMKEENETLKHRIQLMEEGHSKDITMMVGRKMDGPASSEEVEELQEKLRQSEVQKDRLITAFKKTSHDFREAVYQLTGYKIDGLNGNQYRLTPVYAENPDDHLLFSR